MVHFLRQFLFGAVPTTLFLTLSVFLLTLCLSVHATGNEKDVNKQVPSYNQNCSTDLDCTSPEKETFLICDRSDGHTCQCEHSFSYIKDRGQCLISPRGLCTTKRPTDAKTQIQDCVPNAFCKPFGVSSENGICTCLENSYIKFDKLKGLCNDTRPKNHHLASFFSSAETSNFCSHLIILLVAMNLGLWI